MRHIYRYAALVLGIIASVALVGTVIPYSSTEYKRCYFCRATLKYQRVFGICINKKFYENKFTKFYYYEVDKKHSHSWQWKSWYATYTHGTRHGHISSPPIDRFDSDILASIIRTLPINERIHFVEKFSFPQSESEREVVRRLDDSAEVIEHLYKANPHRTDWPEILASLKLWP